MPMSQNKLDTVKTIPQNINNDDEKVKDNISDTLYFPLEKYHGNWKDPEAVTIWQISDSLLKKPMC